MTASRESTMGECGTPRRDADAFASGGWFRYETNPMAPERAIKKKRAAGGARRPSDSVLLKKRTDPRSERRFEPKVTPRLIGSVVAISIGAVAAGAGTYGRWLRDDELGAHPYAIYLLLGGAAVIVLVALLGQRPAPPVRVGDGGIALERDPTQLERVPWYEIKSIKRDGKLLTISAPGTVLTLDLETHPDAAAAAIREAKQRIPDRVPSGLAVPPATGEGQRLTLDPPQIAGLHCKSSDKLIAFDKDARLCGRCGQHYHRTSVPQRCLVCDARLR